MSKSFHISPDICLMDLDTDSQECSGARDPPLRMGAAVRLDDDRTRTGKATLGLPRRITDPAIAIPKTSAGWSRNSPGRPH
jgi:hypothetical protein